MDTLVKMAFGGFLAMIAIVAMIDTSPGSHKNIVENAIKECEKDLPRSQHCKIIAVPKE